MKQNSKVIHEKYEFRNIHKDEIEQAAEIESICFPPNEACTYEHMESRIKKASDLFLVVVDRETGKIAGFLNGLATDREHLTDDFFTDANLHDPEGGSPIDSDDCITSSVVPPDSTCMIASR